MSDDWEDQDLTIPVLSVQNEEQLKRLDERKLVEESDNALTKSLFSNEEDILKKDLEIKKQKHTFTEKKAPKTIDVDKKKENEQKQKELSKKIKEDKKRNERLKKVFGEAEEDDDEKYAKYEDMFYETNLKI